MVYVAEEQPESRDAVELAGELEGEGYTVEIKHWEDDTTVQSAEIYDIYVTPSFVVTNDDGKYIEHWLGTVPGAAEIKHFLIHD